MTRAEGLQRVVDLGNGVFPTPDHVDTFLAMPQDEQEEYLREMELAGKVQKSSAVWSDILAVLVVIGTVAGVVSGVSGAISAVYGLRAL